MLQKLLYQLYANMVSASVEHFVKEFKTMKRQDLVDLRRIEGYGLVYTGAGDVGLYIRSLIKLPKLSQNYL